MKNKQFLLLKLITIFLYFSLSLQANTYPNKEINMVVGFSEGGGTNQMARIMANFLEEELQQKINIITIPGEGSYLAARFFLQQANDGYTIFASTLAPYLANTITTEQANYKIDDFSMINLQWFDTDMIVVNKFSKIKNLHSLLKEIKTHPKTIKAAVIYKSSGHLLLNVLLEKYNISKEYLKLSFYKGGDDVRKALIKENLDFIIVPSQGSETYRELFKAIAINSLERAKRWDAPTLNESLSQININIPLLHGSMRGFCISKKFKDNYPLRYQILVKAFRKTLAKKKVQKELKKYKIGYSWVGPTQSNKLIEESYFTYKKYVHLLK